MASFMLDIHVVNDFIIKSKDDQISLYAIFPGNA